MANREMDDAWLEAELDRELEAMSDIDIGDDASECEEVETQSLAGKLPEQQSDQRGAWEDQAEDAPTSLPASFLELMQGLQDWETSMAVSTEKEIQHLDEDAEMAQRQLRQPLEAGDVAETLDAEEREIFSAEVVGLKCAEAWWRFAVRLSATTNKAEAAACPDDAPKEGFLCAGLEPIAGLGSPTGNSPGMLASSADTGAAEGLSAFVASEIEESQPSAVNATDPDEQLLRRVEEEQKRIGAESAALLAKLEVERAARLLAMEQEEEARRREEDRLREERAMYSEELRLREFIEFRRRCRRREQRSMAWEDRRGSQVRLEERKEEERVQRQREAQEADKRRQEEERAARRRKLEEEAEKKRLEEEARKKREAEEKRRKHEEAEKKRQEELAEKRRREEEAEKRRHDEEVEKRRLQEEAERKMHEEELERKRQDEVKRMAVEDGLSALVQQPLEAMSAARDWRTGAGASRNRKSAKFAAGHFAANAVHCVSEPSEALAAISLPPISKSPVSASEDVTSIVNHAPKIAINPWAEVMQSEVSRGASSKTSVSQVGSPAHLDSSCHLCCQALCKAIDTWQKTPQIWKRPAVASVNGTDELLLEKVTASKPLHKQPKHAGPPLELDLDMLGLDPGAEKDLVRLEIKQEGLQRFPNLAFAARLRILDLTGNQLKNLEALVDCPLLEEVVLCQNSLTTLKGIQQLKRLVVFKATANEIADAAELSTLPSLRVVALSVNHLRTVHWQTSSLTKLELYGNALVSSNFLEYLPSLTYLDLGRNRLTAISPRISEWNPLLVKLHLYENMITSLSELQLPLLTDLVLNKNSLDSLGPLGFLPSLERLEAKYNNIHVLHSPISASPLLHTLALTDNQLGSVAAVGSVFEYPRLRYLHLNDNPFSCEPLMDPARYRSWVLERAPQLQELDNEPFSEAEKLSAAARQAVHDPYLAHQLSPAEFLSKAQPAASSRRRRPSAAGDHGLLGLAELAPADTEQATRGMPGTLEVTCTITGAGIVRARRRHMLSRWQHACSHGGAGDGGGGGCEACGLALWCESLIWARTTPLGAHMRDERLFASRVEKLSKDLREEEFLHVLRRRRDFWDSFMDICAGHYEALRAWRQTSSQVCRTGAFEFRGAERSRQRLVSRIQACWRSKLARRRCAMLQLERRCHQLSEQHLQAVVRVQALCRGVLARQGLRAAGVQLPRERKAAGEHARNEQAAARIQAAVRGSRARRKLQKATNWAKEMSKLTDDDIGDLPEFDVNQFLADVKTFDPANPFEELRIPQPVARQAPTQKASGIEATLNSALVSSSGRSTPKMTRDLPHRTPSAPMEAWCTPPATATLLPASPSPAAPHIAAGSYDGGSSAGSPMSGRGDGQVRRSRSMSSTAESAITECEGLARPSREQQIQEDWNLQDPSTARSILAAQRRRARPPGLPKVSQNASGSSFGAAPARSGNSRRGGPLSRGGGAALLGRGRGSGSSAQSQGGTGAPKKVLKAQDCIAEFFKARQDEEARQRQSPDHETMEFQSGAPNLRLLRMQSPNSSFSPRSRDRAASPLRMSGSL